jgi:hypothetical protein
VIIIIYTTFMENCHYPVPGTIPGRDLVQRAVSRAIRVGFQRHAYYEPNNTRQMENIITTRARKAVAGKALIVAQAKEIYNFNKGKDKYGSAKESNCGRRYGCTGK